jgi:lysophospholipase L1-like esterase
LELCKGQGNPRITLVGHVPDLKKPSVRIEGYGGWTAQRFMTYFKAEKRPEGELDWRVWNACSSPFLYADGHGQFKADFARYCQEFNQGRGPDFVTLIFGGNDVSSCTEETIETGIDTMLKHYDALIAMIHQVRKDTKIGAVLMYPPAASQDAFGANYRCGLKYWQCKRNLHRVCERLIERYGNRETDQIYLVPVKNNLDCEHNFPVLKTRWNAQTKSEGVRLNNALHPAAEGYRQIGDTIYCWMKAQLTSAKVREPASSR